jgi:hypothetical protein
MIRASRFGGLNHVAVTNPNAEARRIGMSASGQSGKHVLHQSITEFDPKRTCAAVQSGGNSTNLRPTGYLALSKTDYDFRGSQWLTRAVHRRCLAIAS